MILSRIIALFPINMATINDVIRNNPKPITAKLDDAVLEALSKMKIHNYSQLPVIDTKGRALGMITSDSILHALRNLDLSLNKLKVSHVMTKDYIKFRSDEDLLLAQKRLIDIHGALIVGADDMLEGIITFYDTASYFRGLAENIMLVRDIETRLREHVQAAFNYDPQIIEENIQKIAHNPNEISFGKFKGIFNKYLRNNAHTVNIEQDNLKTAFEELQPKSKPKSFEKLSLNEYISLLVDTDKWESYQDVFHGIDKTTLKKLLSDIREMRNVLAHFKRDLSSDEIEKLRWCAGFMERYPTRNTPTLVISDNQVAGSSSAQNMQVDFESNDDEPNNKSKYAPLATHLQKQPSAQNSLILTFAEIEKIIASPLPDSAQQYRSWWANDSVGHVQSKNWLDVDWRVTDVNLSENYVTFTRMIERKRAYITFFTALQSDLQKTKAKWPLYNTSSGDNWCVFDSIQRNGKNIGVLSVVFNRHKRISIELYLNKSKEENKELFDILKQNKQSIETRIATKLSWERLDDKVASRIAIYHNGHLQMNIEELTQLRQRVINALQALRTEFQSQMDMLK